MEKTLNPLRSCSFGIPSIPKKEQAVCCSLSAFGSKPREQANSLESKRLVRLVPKEQARSKILPPCSPACSGRAREQAKEQPPKAGLRSCVSKPSKPGIFCSRSVFVSVKTHLTPYVSIARGRFLIRCALADPKPKERNDSKTRSESAPERGLVARWAGDIA